MKIHKLADLFPEMSKDEFATLVADIEANGLIEPISIYQDEIIDGKHRFKACKAAKVKPIFTEYKGDDPLGFVISRNLSRRHLTVHEKAMIAAEICNGKLGSNQWLKDTPGGASISEMAKTLGISERSINRAKKILHIGSAKLIEQVRAGLVSLDEGFWIAELPKGDQPKALVARQKRKDVVAAQKKKRKRRDANHEAPLNSLAWSNANRALRQKWIDNVGVKSIWEAMTSEHKDQLAEIVDAENREAEDAQDRASA